MGRRPEESSALLTSLMAGHSSWLRLPLARHRSLAHVAPADSVLAARVTAVQAAGRPSVLLCDSSARVLLELPSEKGLATARAFLCEIAKAEGAALVRGLEVVMFADHTLRVKLGAHGSVAKLDGMAIGFFATLLSSKPWAVDEGAAEAEEEVPATKDAVEIA